MKLLRIISVALVAVFTLVTTNMSVSNAAGTYGISCKNNAYGMHLGTDYTQQAYVYNALITKLVDGTAAANSGQYLIGGPNAGHQEAYVGNDCIYSGSADTNGTAVVAGDVARLAVNAIVGAVTNRIDMAYFQKSLFPYLPRYLIHLLFC